MQHILRREAERKQWSPFCCHVSCKLSLSLPSKMLFFLFRMNHSAGHSGAPAATIPCSECWAVWEWERGDTQVCCSLRIRHPPGKCQTRTVFRLCGVLWCTCAGILALFLVWITLLLATKLTVYLLTLHDLMSWCISVAIRFQGNNRK